MLEQTKPEQAHEDIALAEVFARFYEAHGRHLVTAGDVARTLRYWLDFHATASVSEALEPAAQEQFREWLAQEKGLAPATVRRALLVGKSALNWAYKRGEIGQLPHIALVTPPKPEPKGRPLEVDEVAALFRATDEAHLRVLIAFMLGSAARTGAVLDLRLAQIDVARRLIDLNPPGRQQTLKHRPTVKLPEQLVDYVTVRTRDSIAPLVHIDRQPIASIKRSWTTARRRSGLSGNVQTYSFRHTMARWLRMHGVPAWEVAAQLGHKSADYTTTEIYAPFDPAYLSKAVAAIDAFLGQVACELRVKTMSEWLI